MRRSGVLLALAVAVTVVGCTADGDDSRSATAGLPSTRRDLESHTWELVQPEHLATAGRGATLVFDGDGAHGHAPCNTFRASFSLDDDGDGISLDDIATTKQACPDPVMRAEAAYLRALGSADHADVDDDGEELVLSGSDPRLVLHASAPEATTTGGTP